MDRRTFAAEQIINKLRQAEVLLQSWRKGYNHIRPHSSIGYRPPALVAVLHRVSAAGAGGCPAGPRRCRSYLSGGTMIGVRSVMHHVESTGRHPQVKR
jgi:hypothetical protein